MGSSPRQADLERQERVMSVVVLIPGSLQHRLGGIQAPRDAQEPRAETRGSHKSPQDVFEHHTGNNLYEIASHGENVWDRGDSNTLKTEAYQPRRRRRGT